MATQTSLKDYFGVPPTSGLALAEAVEKGLPIQSLDGLREAGLTFTEMAAVIPPRTLKHRRARGENLSVGETERAIRVASTIALAEKVFADSEKAMHWLRGKDERLEGRTPLSMLQTETGARLIQSMLWGIDEGVYS